VREDGGKGDDDRALECCSQESPLLNKRKGLLGPIPSSFWGKREWLAVAQNLKVGRLNKKRRADYLPLSAVKTRGGKGSTNLKSCTFLLLSVGNTRATSGRPKKLTDPTEKIDGQNSV